LTHSDEGVSMSNSGVISELSSVTQVVEVQMVERTAANNRSRLRGREAPEIVDFASS
jgi:hypothetical protein